MSQDNPAVTYYAAVKWSPNDVLDEAPDLTYAEAEAWLSRNARRIQDAMIEAGWDAMRDLLAYEISRAATEDTAP